MTKYAITVDPAVLRKIAAMSLDTQQRVQEAVERATASIADAMLEEIYAEYVRNINAIERGEPVAPAHPRPRPDYMTPYQAFMALELQRLSASGAVEMIDAPPCPVDYTDEEAPDA